MRAGGRKKEWASKEGEGLGQKNTKKGAKKRGGPNLFARKERWRKGVGTGKDTTKRTRKSQT